jgi:hypothetical protein
MGLVPLHEDPDLRSQAWRWWPSLSLELVGLLVVVDLEPHLVPVASWHTRISVKIEL